MPDSYEKDHLLGILEAHGQAFLASFGSVDHLASSSKRRNGHPMTPSSKRRRISEEPDNNKEEEWHGISAKVHPDDEDEGIENDDNFVADSSSTDVIVFSNVAPKKPASQNALSKAQMKAFMSSKIHKLRGIDSESPQRAQDPEDEEEDWTNAQNDALLHKLIHTNLLSGSLNKDLVLSPAKKRKALAGRILELIGDAKIGKGEKLVRETERNKAAKHVREGIALKQRYRQKQELEEAKNLGNYHPSLKKLFEAPSSSSTVRKRQKGLGMGVGNFRNGSLRLTKDDVHRVIGEGHSRISSQWHGRSKDRR